MKVLFILKRREDFDPTHTTVMLSIGLFNSASFVNEMLVKNGIDSKLIVAIDNNYIDKEVHDFKPDVVFIEALWVVPEKFDILQKLHPKVKWIVRIHSDLPFLAQEGIAMQWIFDYVKHDKVLVAPNSSKMTTDIQNIVNIATGHTEKSIPYLPNYYPISTIVLPKIIDQNKDTIDISCFGAIRPLKNQLIQAHAAIGFAANRNLKLRFHMNSGRIETNGLPVDHSLRGLFEHLDPKYFQLILHKWTTHENFIDIIKTIDIGMQVSFSETFNIVGADHVVNGIPFLGCNEIPWWNGNVSTTDRYNIIDNLEYIYRNSEENVMRNQIGLVQYGINSQRIWLNYLKGIENAS